METEDNIFAVGLERHLHYWRGDMNELGLRDVRWMDLLER
jgi:hypothetical protein